MAAYGRVDDLADGWLTACTPGLVPGPTLGNEYGKPLPLPLLSTSSVFNRTGAYCILLCCNCM